MPKRNSNQLVLEDVRIVLRNFAGKEGQYNREGDRNFAVVLDDQQAEDMRRDGWNVKTKPSMEEGEQNFNYLPVSVSFKGRPPRLVLISSGGRTNLDESMCELMDWVDIEQVDLILNPYQWAVSGKTGTKAYLHAIYVTIHEDELEKKYRDIPEIDAKGNRLALPAGEDPNVIDGEVLEDYEDDEPLALPSGRRRK